MTAHRKDNPRSNFDWVPLAVRDSTAPDLSGLDPDTDYEVSSSTGYDAITFSVESHAAARAWVQAIVSSPRLLSLFGKKGITLRGDTMDGAAGMYSFTTGQSVRFSTGVAPTELLVSLAPNGGMTTAERWRHYCLDTLRRPARRRAGHYRLDLASRMELPMSVD